MLQEFDSDKKKLINKTLRFVAHYYAASLIVGAAYLNMLNLIFSCYCWIRLLDF